MKKVTKIHKIEAFHVLRPGKDEAEDDQPDQAAFCITAAHYNKDFVMVSLSLFLIIILPGLIKFALHWMEINMKVALFPSVLIRLRNVTGRSKT